MDIKSLTVEPGFILIDNGSGPPRQVPIADVLRALDIPIGLTHEQVAGISLLANLFTILVRTLIDRDVLDEDFADSLGMDWDLDHLVYAVEQMGGSYHDPNLDDVEDA